MDLTGLLVLGFLWFLFNLLTKGREQGRSRPQPPPVPRSGTGDPTQREGSQLETLFRELQRTLNEAAIPERPAPVKSGPRGRPAAAPLPSAEEVEERESLEIGSRVVSLEDEVHRPNRVHINHDTHAEHLVAARIAAAEARSGSLTRADHTAFDARIRQEPADATAVRAPSPEQLRRAMVWREILGPPAALREPER